MSTPFFGLLSPVARRLLANPPQLGCRDWDLQMSRVSQEITGAETRRAGTRRAGTGGQGEQGQREQGQGYISARQGMLPVICAHSRLLLLRMKRPAARSVPSKYQRWGGWQDGTGLSYGIPGCMAGWDGGRAAIPDSAHQVERGGVLCALRTRV